MAKYDTLAKYAVLVSGGVDSSVALKLLKDAGCDVTAFYLKIWLEADTQHLGDCPWEDDLGYARDVCEQLGVELRIVPLQKEYHERVIAYALHEVKHGRTPNPDVLCNSQVKFGAFFDVVGREFDFVATGHYAGVEQVDGMYFLTLSADAIKDQTYFLALLNQTQLKRACFPLSKLAKDEVRNIARISGFPTGDRVDSQGLCFLGEIPYDEYLKHHLGTKTGEIINKDTHTVLGTHDGFWFYTIGQRHGLNLPGGPWYVIGKDIDKNIVWVSHRLRMADVEKREFYVEMKTFIPKNVGGGSIKEHHDVAVFEDLRVKVRHGPKLYACRLEFRESAGHVVLRDVAERGIAAGQYAVFYSGKYCLGAGVIVE